LDHLDEEGEYELLAIAKKLRGKEFEMATTKATDIWEEMRRTGAITPGQEAKLNEKVAQTVEFISQHAGDVDPTDVMLFFDEMTDEQASRVVNSLDTLGLAPIVGKLRGKKRERALSLMKDAEQRVLIERLIKEHDERRNRAKSN
jgi:hypothetical protein